MPAATPRLYVAITPHGYGHLSMTGAVLDALRARRPDVAVTVETTLPDSVVRARVPADATLVAETEDFGLVMRDATIFDAAASAARYRALHADWDGVVDRAARRMAAQAPDAVLSNVGYVALAAAARLGIPAVALGPFTWAHIVRAHCALGPDAPVLLETMTRAYASARAVLAATPGLPLDDLPNARPIGPVGQPVPARPDALRRELGVGPETRLAVVTFGGVASGISLESWPRESGWLWLVRGGVAPDHPDARDMAALPHWSFPEIVAASDAVVTKLGYGMAMECGLNQRPTVYWPRADGWIEEPYLRDWLARHAPLAAVPPERLRTGVILEDLEAVTRRPPPGPPPRATGADEAAAVLDDILSGG
ncbi:hypothetical protein [Roseospira navarrensis]|uniref:Glycosyltransferase n=1 Tax=Roseospira navarrensis TaxID=140058 RepID=A0A7X1ZFF1_9PROT|nr:hypothetical protein [Roseospira navarrensis]MQX37323.1 hypothetical protein [Roseospira navarrensis]